MKAMIKFSSIVASLSHPWCQLSLGESDTMHSAYQQISKQLIGQRAVPIVLPQEVV